MKGSGHCSVSSSAFQGDLNNINDLNFVAVFFSFSVSLLSLVYAVLFLFKQTNALIKTWGTLIQECHQTDDVT